MSIDRQNTVIEKLAENEALIGNLYQTYAAAFPEYRQFWLSLAGDENIHAVWVRQLTQEISNGRYYFNPERFNAAAIQTQIDYIGEYIKRARNQQITLIEALSTAFHLAESLLESKYFEIVGAESPGSKEILVRLEEATLTHAQQIRATWHHYVNNEGIS